jgi:hypothetical protein
MSISPLACNAATLIQLSPHTFIEKITSLPIEQLWWSTKLQIAEGEDVSVGFHMFDEENRPEQGRLAGCGWVLIGTSDLGSEPVGIRIWSDTQCALLVKLADAGPGAKQQFTLRVKRGEQYQIRIGEHSNVSIAGHDVGAIK